MENLSWSREQVFENVESFCNALGYSNVVDLNFIPFYYKLPLSLALAYERRFEDSKEWPKDSSIIFDFINLLRDESEDWVEAYNDEVVEDTEDYYYFDSYELEDSLYYSKKNYLNCIPSDVYNEYYPEIIDYILKKYKNDEVLTKYNFFSSIINELCRDNDRSCLLRTSDCGFDTLKIKYRVNDEEYIIPNTIHIFNTIHLVLDSARTDEHKTFLINERRDSSLEYVSEFNYIFKNFGYLKNLNITKEENVLLLTCLLKDFDTYTEEGKQLRESGILSEEEWESGKSFIKSWMAAVEKESYTKESFFETLSFARVLNLVVDNQVNETRIQEALTYLNPRDGQYIGIVDKSFLKIQSDLIKKLVDDNLLDAVVQTSESAVLSIKLSKTTNAVLFAFTENNISEYALKDIKRMNAVCSTDDIKNNNYCLSVEYYVSKSEKEVLNLIDEFMDKFDQLESKARSTGYFEYSTQDFVYDKRELQLSLIYAKKFKAVGAILNSSELLPIRDPNVGDLFYDKEIANDIVHLLKEGITAFKKCCGDYQIREVFDTLDKVDTPSFNRHYRSIISRIIGKSSAKWDLLKILHGDYPIGKILFDEQETDDVDVDMDLLSASDEFYFNLYNTKFCFKPGYYVIADAFYGKLASKHLIPINKSSVLDSRVTDKSMVPEDYKQLINKESFDCIFDVNPFYDQEYPIEQILNGQNGKDRCLFAEYSIEYLNNKAPLFQKWIESNILDSIVVFNNRALLCFKNNRTDTSIRIVKANFVDIVSLNESYEVLLNELRTGKDGSHTRTISAETFIKNNYSLDVYSYFAHNKCNNLESVILEIFDRLMALCPAGENKGRFFSLMILGILDRIYQLKKCLNGVKPFTKDLPNEKRKVAIASIAGLEEVLLDSFEEAVDALLDLSSKNGLFETALSYQKKELTELIAKLGQDSCDQIKVFNPFAGTASYALQFKDGNYVGEEIDWLHWSIGNIRLLSHNIDNSRYTLTNSLESELTSEEKFDCILSTPPFSDQKFYEYLFTDCLDKLNEGGQMAVVLPSNFLYRRVFWDIRRNLVNRKLIESVILLPDGMFDDRSIKGSVIVKLNKKENQSILFVNARQLCENHKFLGPILHVDEILDVISNNNPDHCQSIPIESIQQQDLYLLNPRLYNAIEIPEGYKSYRLQDVLNPRNLPNNSEHKIGKVLLKENMSADFTDFLRDSDSFPEKELDGMYKICKAGTLVLSRTPQSMRPTYCKLSKDRVPFFINHTMMAFEINKDIVSPEFLCYLLAQPMFTDQIRLYQSDIQPMDWSLIKDVRVLIPILEKQDQKLKEVYNNHYHEEKKDAQQTYSRLDMEREEEFKSLKHAFGKPAAGIQAAIDQLIEYFEDEGMMDTIINERRSSTLRDKLSIIKDSAEFMETLMKNGANFLDLSKYPLESVSVRDLWNQIDMESDMFATAYSDRIDNELVQPTVQVNLNLVKILINDIRSNAEKHAFTKEDPRNEVVIDANNDGSNFVLLIYNNGVPFPENVDTAQFTKRHWSAGDSRGSGIGGNDIQKIMRHFGGNFELITDYSPLFPTCYLLKFPLE